MMTDTNNDLPTIAKTARVRLGLSQEAVAERVGVTQQAIQQLEAGEVSRPRYLRKLARVLKDDRLSSIALKAEIDETTDELEEAQADFNKMDLTLEMARRNDRFRLTKLLPPSLGRSDLPIFASARGDTAEMILSFEAIEYVKRPEPLLNVSRGFGVYVIGDSMEPLYSPGDMVLCHPTLPPRKDNDVVVICSADGVVHEAMIKRYMTSDDNVVRLRQFNPPNAAPIEVPWTNLFGVFVIVGKYNRR